MLSKRARSSSAKAQSGARRLRTQIVDHFAGNVLSGTAAQDMATAADDAGLPEFGDIHNKSDQHPEKHAARNLRRRLMKKRAWPDLYKAKIPTWSPKKRRIEEAEMSFILPHAAVAMIHEFGGEELSMFDTSNMDPLCKAHFDSQRARLPQDLPILGLGLWVDGVPCNWDRSESIEVLRAQTQNPKPEPAPPPSRNHHTKTKTEKNQQGWVRELNCCCGMCLSY